MIYPRDRAFPVDGCMIMAAGCSGAVRSSLFETSLYGSCFSSDPYLGMDSLLDSLSLGLEPLNDSTVSVSVVYLAFGRRSERFFFIMRLRGLGYLLSGC